MSQTSASCVGNCSKPSESGAEACKETMELALQSAVYLDYLSVEDQLVQAFYQQASVTTNTRRTDRQKGPVGGRVTLRRALAGGRDQGAQGVRVGPSPRGPPAKALLRELLPRLPPLQLPLLPLLPHLLPMQVRGAVRGQVLGQGQRLQVRHCGPHRQGAGGRTLL